ncbi:Uncharacterised protein [Mycobacteroides abscessus subsp. abscessus]|nr:Uncharacterised protein [Mycobacteroides abscessus subsp. abscessus]
MSTTEGEVSSKTALTRSRLEPRCGKGSGTAISPACMEPRNARMYSRLCGARISARSPGEACWPSSRATLKVRRDS